MSSHAATTFLVLTACVVSAYAAIIDLTHPITKDTPYWFKGTFVVTPFVRQTDPHWVKSNKLSTAEHGGTHIDVPYHFNQNDWLLGQVPLTRLFIVEGVLINKTEEVLENPEYQLTVKDLEGWESQHGPLPETCVVLVMFGWASKYPDRQPYLGLQDDGDWDRHFPSISGDAAKWIVNTGKVYGVGTDTASPDSKGEPIVHKTLTKNNLFILENLDLKNLEGRVPPRGFKLAILPKRVEEGTGGPVHVVLVTKDNEEKKELSRV